MQCWKNFHPLLRGSRQSFKPTRLGNLLALVQTRKLHQPNKTPLTNVESEDSAVFLAHKTKSLGRAPDNVAAMATKDELTVLADYSDGHYGYGDECTRETESALKCNQDGNESQSPSFGNIITTETTSLRGKQNNNTQAEKLLSGFLFNSYLFCLIIIPHLDQFL